MTSVQPPSESQLAMRAEHLARALARIDAALDWPRLERVYCEVDPDVPTDQLIGFFAPEQRAIHTDGGLRFASDLVGRLRAGGQSLYVGAGVAELGPMVAECVLLGRSVRLVTLPGPEAEELGRAFQSAQDGLAFALPKVDTRPLGSFDTGPVDHLWFASVLTDPEAFPALHQALYGLGQPKGKALLAERARALALLEKALAQLSPRGWLTTSDEELDLVRAALAQRGWSAHVPEEGRLSVLVGDVLRHLSLSPNLPAAGPSAMLGPARRRAPQRPPRP